VTAEGDREVQTSRLPYPLIAVPTPLFLAPASLLGLASAHVLFFALFFSLRTVEVRREGPGAGFGFTLSGSSPVFIKNVDRGTVCD